MQRSWRWYRGHEFPDVRLQRSAAYAKGGKIDYGLSANSSNIFTGLHLLRMAEGGEAGLDAAYPYSVEDYNRLSPLGSQELQRGSSHQRISARFGDSLAIRYDRRGLPSGQIPSVAGAGNQNTDAQFQRCLVRGSGETDDQGPASPVCILPKAGGVTPIPAVSLPMGGPFRSANGWS